MNMSIKKKKKLVIILSVILVVILALVAGFNLYADSLLNRMKQTEPFQEGEVSQAEVNQNVDNILLLGIDADEGSGARTDVMKLISLNYDTGKIIITSLQRDNIVWQPENNRYEKLNHAYWRNGVKGTISAVNYNFDLNVTKYVLFSFDSVKEIVDILGGVDIQLSGVEAGVLGLGGAGTYHLNGEQTLSFSRIRSVDSDYQRMARQTRVINAVVQKFADNSPLSMLATINEVLPYLETNISNNNIKSYITSMFSLDLRNIQQYQFPQNGYDSILTSLTLYGYGPQYVLKDFSGEVELLHQQIYGDNYTASERVLEVENGILKLAGY